MDTLVLKAEQFARRCHDGQYRKYNGKPYIVHPERVAKRVAEYTNNENIIAAAWLHDVVEDCDITLDNIEKEFGVVVRGLVDELTNPSKAYPELKRDERKKIDREHIKQASANAQLIKIIDRLDNLYDMRNTPNSFKIKYYRESFLLSWVLTKAPKDLISELMEISYWRDKYEEL